MDNPELGRKVVNVADVNPELFDMQTWAALAAKRFNDPNICGTVACLAGHAMLLSGYQAVFNGLGQSGTFMGPDGYSVYGGIGDEAAKLLGLTDEERYGPDVKYGFDEEPDGDDIFFDWANGLDRFRKIVEAAEGQQDA